MCRVFSYNIPKRFSLPGFAMFFRDPLGGRDGCQEGCAVLGCRKSLSESRPGPRMAGAVLVAALSLGGCADRVLETGAGYTYLKGYFVDTPPSPPTPVRKMSNRNPDYPTLYTVPMRATPIPSPNERKTALGLVQKDVDRLAADLRAAHADDEALQEIAPLPLPPPPPGTSPNKATGGGDAAASGESLTLGR